MKRLSWLSCLLLPALSGAIPSLPRSSNTQEDPIIGGQGNWRFQYRPVKLPRAAQNNVLDGHGLALDPDTGDFYFIFHPKIWNNHTQTLVRFSKARLPQLLGGGLLSRGIPHGLRFEQDGDTKYLYHANNEQRVTKTTIDGDILWSTDFSDWETRYPQFWPILPTDAIAVPGTDLLLVADGYGSAWIHALNKTTGTFIEGRSFGGRGSSNVEPKFSLPHSISLDHDREAAQVDKPLFIVSDRSNNRLIWVTQDGDFIKEVHTNIDVTPLPCNIDNSHIDLRTGGPVSLIPSLGHSYESLVNGSVTIYKGRNFSDSHMEIHLLATIEIAQLLGHEGHQHPHDAIFLPNGDLMVCCWSGPDNPTQGPARGTISYWERLTIAKYGIDSQA